MNPILYVDKFRGFVDSYLCLKHVNFFVGENSTGKTSLLRLIKIISDNDFWFKSGEQQLIKEFGTFSEITTEEYFKIGLVAVNTQSFILLTFVESKGAAKLSEIAHMNKNSNILIRLKSNSWTYKLETGDFDNLFGDSYFDNFKNWIADNGLSNTKFENRKPANLNSLPLIFQIQVLLNSKNTDKKIDIRFDIPNLVQRLVWSAPIRTEPKKTYDSYDETFVPEGNHIPFILKKQLGNVKPNLQNKKFEKILNKFGEDSGLFQKITVTQYGKSNMSPFEINVVLNNKPLKITNVGYGISQILPLIVEIVIRRDNTWFAIQQPEIHLHPKGQAAFGDLLFKAAVNDSKSFIVETHSDFTIDRFRLKQNQYHKTNKDSEDYGQVIFFRRVDEGNKLYAINICKDGTYSHEQPSEFQEFFMKEELALLQI